MSFITTSFFVASSFSCRDLMSYITASFFIASSFSFRDSVSLSQLKLLSIPLILVATKFSVAT